MSQQKVLVIDDNRDILDAVCLLLEDAGYAVVTSEQIDPQLNIVLKTRPDIILLDMLLSGTNGKDVLVSLKKSPVTKQIPVIMVSAHPTAAEAAKESGADDFIPKPFDIDELLSLIKKHTVS